MKNYTLLVLLIFGICCTTSEKKNPKYALANPNSLSMKFINGLWYNGASFERKTVWLENGILRFSKIKALDTVIDLENRFVIPPFAEAHNHNLESEYGLDKRINAYLENGVFYVKLLSSIKKRIAPLMHNYNKPDGLDVQMAHAPLTGNGGHPIALRKRFLQMGHFRGIFNSLRDIESHGYFIIDSLKQLEDKWENILSFEPDFIKIMLLHSEEYAQRKNDTIYFGKKGLDPGLVKAIVDKSHNSGLRVSVHVATSYDFHVAVKAGVDEVAHLPEIHNGNPITKEDALLAKKKGITVVTTISLVEKNRDRENYRQLVENVRHNLEILKSVDVKLAIGSDMYNDTSVHEFNLLNELNVFSSQELLTMWTENATETIFPYRKIGKLKEGYEASFLVLHKNPIEDISNINQSISLRIKQGVILK
ncbi:MAG: amidohydrolase family protein [Bacteroidota bacterium]